MQFNPTHLIWIDLEMTGLDPDSNCILEIATVVTDLQLAVVAEGPVLAIHCSDERLNQMDEWCIKQHGSSGLTERVRASQISAAQAERLTLDFLQQYVPQGKSPMCGNSICQDRRFLYREMPELEQYFHYRNYDVSVLKMIAKNYYPEIARGFHKKPQHQALSDIYDSINEMRYYQQQLLVKS